ncbi:MAG: hypothetical protein MJ240_13625 [Kiritimatiellae bacterium]|nr:hypothetical protein [Kiritimatiellia bacterium]
MKRVMLWLASVALGTVWGLDITGNVVVDEASLGTYAALSTSDEINVPAGAVLDFQNATTKLDLKAKLVGAGTVKATGAAELTLSGDNGGFSGSFDFADTRVVVNHAAAFGTAAVNFSNSSTSTGVPSDAMAMAFAAAGTYANTFVFSSKFLLSAMADVVFSGDVTLNTIYGCDVGKQDDTGSITFAGTLTRLTAKSAQLYNFGRTTFASGMTATGFKNLGTNYGFFVNQSAVLTVACDLVANTDINRLYTAKGTIRCARANVYTAGTLTLGSTSSPYGTFDLNGYDQSIGQLDAPRANGTTATIANLAASSAAITSATPAVFTVFNGTSGTWDMAFVTFEGAVSVVFGDGVNAKNFKLAANIKKGTSIPHASTTTGTLTLDTPGGELALSETVNFTQLAGVVLKAGRLVLESDAQVAANDLTFHAGGSLELPEGYTYTCERLFVADVTAPDGVRQLAAGTYTAASEELPEGALTGSGELVVTANPPVEEAVTRHWQGATGAAFEAPANWQEGEAPDSEARNAKVVFAAAGAGDSATLNADASVYGVQVNKNFTLAGAEQTLALGTNGITVAANCAFTNNAALLVDERDERWALGPGASLVLNGDLASQESDFPLTIAGANGVAPNAALVFNGSGADFAAAGVVVTNVSAVTVGSSDAFGAAGLTTYDGVMPYFTVSSNASPFTVCDIADDAHKDVAFFDATKGPFIQTGPVRLEGQSNARMHLNFWNSASFFGGITLKGRAQFNFKTMVGETVVRIDGMPVKSLSGGSNMDIRGQLCASNTVFLAIPHTDVAASILLGRAKLVCGAENVLPQTYGIGLTLGIQSSRQDADGRLAWLDLNGLDQTFYLNPPPDYSKMSLKRTDYAEISSVTPATLTSYSATQGARSPQLLKFTGQVSFTQDVGPKYGVTFSNVVSTTTGALRAKRGRLGFATNAGWGGGTDVTIEAQGRIVVAADAAHSAFASVDPNGPRSIVKLAVEQGGILELAGGTVAVAAAYRPEGESTAEQLRAVHAQGLKRGLYAAADSAEEAGVTRVDWIAGAGKLRVLGQSGTSIYLR